MTDCLDQLVDIIHAGWLERWTEENERIFKGLFGADGGRYPRNAEQIMALRAPAQDPDSGIPFAAYLHPSNPRSGRYSGMSFAIFPVQDQPCLVSLVIGTQGLSPDEAILGRPGHARKVQAICSWLNAEFGGGEQVAWAKQDPTRIDLGVPENLRHQWKAYPRVYDKYGNYLYALFRPTDDRRATRQAVAAFLDLLFQERAIEPLSKYAQPAQEIRDSWFRCLMPQVQDDEVVRLLAQRRYVILQGPPGTGKTRMARNILHDCYQGRGRSIQFHPNTTYENFVGGLAPKSIKGELGFRFEPKLGFLMEAAKAALEDPSRDYLLHIDEINRADLAKVLGEAIFLLEAEVERERTIDLPYHFGEPFGSSLSLPPNLHILGTMNSADRSIAIVDIAVRRRFAFISLWPSARVVEENGYGLSMEAFQRLLSIFVEHASEDAFTLIPGHSYFLAGDHESAITKLRTSLAPLLKEYLAQGYVAGFAEHIRSYLQWLEGRCAQPGD
jgi:5-methylcytosine-specific restriction protein B